MTWLLAAAGDIPQLPPLANYGLIGLLLVMLVTGRYLVPKPTLDRADAQAAALEEQVRQERARSDAIQAKLDEMIQTTVDKFVPALVSANATQREAIETLREVTHLLKQVEDLTATIRDLERAAEDLRRINRREP